MNISNKIIALLILGSSAAIALPHPVGEDAYHVVAEKENIFSISRHYGLAPDHVLWANGLSERRPPKVGDKLLIPLRRLLPFTPPESTAIVLNLPERMLYLFRDGKFKEKWGVAIGGSEHPTPIGTFRIMDKEKNPTWDPPGWLQQASVPPGPDNPLGDRWMQITPNMVGIHGTNNPDSIGSAASLGCVRLYPEAIHSIYDQVGVGTKVYAIYEQVRIGEEEDGSLVWSFFPDPYNQQGTVRQAQAALSRARSEGHNIAMAKFELKERMKTPTGTLVHVFGEAIKVHGHPSTEENVAYKRPTGLWLDASVLESYGIEVRKQGSAATLDSSTGKTAHFTEAEVPLNPRRVPWNQGTEPLKLEGHMWDGRVWLPFPLALEYFEIPHKWDRKKSQLTLKRDLLEQAAKE